MIDRTQIGNFLNTKPFRQFALETAGGNYLVVASPDHIKLPPTGFDLVIVYGTDGVVHYVDQTTVLNAAVYGPAPGITGGN